MLLGAGVWVVSKRAIVAGVCARVPLCLVSDDEERLRVIHSCCSTALLTHVTPAPLTGGAQCASQVLQL